MMFVELAMTAAWPAVRAAVQDREPSVSVLASAAFLTSDPTVRHGLLALLAGSEVEGLLPVHRLALTGDAAAIADLDTDLDTPVQVQEIANNPALGRWTAAHIAAGVGHTDVLDVLRARGADLDRSVGNLRERPLDVAVRYDQPASVAWLLDAGSQPGWRSVCNLSPGVSEGVLQALLAAGADLDQERRAMASRLMHGPEPLSVKIDHVRRLTAHGLSLDAQLVLELAHTLERTDPEDIPSVLDGLLAIGDIDLDRPVVTRSPDASERLLIECALREWPVDAVRRLVEAGCEVPALRVEGYRPDAEAKRALLASLGKTPDEPGLAEFMSLADDDVTAERIVRLLAGPGPRIAGVGLGTPEAEVLELGLDDQRDYGYVRGVSSDDSRGRDLCARHELHIWLADERATGAAYRAMFARAEDARSVFDALKQVYTQALGKPRGRKNLSWKTPETQLSLTIGRDGPSWHMVTLVLETPG